MSSSYIVLKSDTDFLTAALAQSKVSVWYREDSDSIGHLMDYGGIVEGYTTELSSLELILFGGGLNLEYT